MALEKHIVELSARDTLSPVLKKVGTEAEAAGRKADDAGKRASRSMQDWNRAASALGAGLGLATAAAIKYANEAEVRQKRLETAIQNTGHAYDEYADAIDKASKSAVKLAFDDDDAIDSLSQLTDASGDAQQAITDLALAQDIARGRNISLAQATDIVIAAETGRIQSLKRMGIEIDASATKEQALAALQQKYAGQAEAYATTNQATWDRVEVAAGNALESIGGHLADYQGAILAVSTAGAALGPVSEAFDAIGGSAKAAAIATRALSLAMGPVGLAVVAAGAAVALYDMIEAQRDVKLTTDEATTSIDDFVASIATIGGNVSPGTRQALADQVEFYQDLATTINTAQTELDRVHREGVPAGTFNLDTDSLDEAEAKTKAYTDALEANILTEDQWNAVLADTQAILNYNNPLNSGVVHQRLDELNQDMAAGKITAEDYAWQVHWLTQNMATYGLTIDDIRAGETALQKQQQRGAEQDVYWSNQRKKARELELDQLERQQAVEERLFNQKNERRGQEQDAFLAENEYPGIIAAEQGLQSIGKAADASSDSVAALDAQLDALGDSLASMTPGDVLDSTFNAIVGNTDKIVGSIDKVKQWSDAIMAPLGTDFQDNGALSKLVELQNKGLLDAEDYTEALKAQTQIYGDLARAQDASAAIQIKQADIIADQTDATADYLENIAKLPEAEQAVALAWADQDISGRAMEIANMAAEFGNMNAAQQEAFSDMVTSAAAADPMLASVLESVGLIKRDVSDPTGWTLVIPADGATASLQDVVDAVDRLTNAILGIPDATVTVTADTSSFYNTIGGIPQIVGDRYINVHGVGFTMATGGVVGAGHLHAIDTAALGRVSGGNLTLVGENGPELVNLPGGSMVTPNHATQFRREAKGSPAVVINNMTVVTPNAQQFMRQMQTYTSAMERN